MGEGRDVWAVGGGLYLPIRLFEVSMSLRSASQTSLEGLRDVSLTKG